MLASRDICIWLGAKQDQGHGYGPVHVCDVSEFTVKTRWHCIIKIHIDLLHVTSAARLGFGREKATWCLVSCAGLA